MLIIDNRVKRSQTMTSLTETIEIPRRLVWLDCVKVIGMYLIIVGHMFPQVGHDLVYGVSVPVFFWVSGYLEKPAEKAILLRKCLMNLFLPALTIILVVRGFSIFQNEDFLSAVKVMFLTGLMSLLGSNGWYGLGVAWFIYTLICLKVLYKLVGVKYITLLIIPAAVIAIILKYQNITIHNSILNVTVAIPFYVAGIWSRRVVWPKINIAVMIVSWSVLVVAYYFLANYNHGPAMYCHQYGEWYSLCVITGLTGVAILVGIAKCMESKMPLQILNVFTLLSEGGLLVLCTHINFLSSFQHHPYAWLIAAVIYVGYIPVIWICHRRFPFIIGRYSSSSITTAAHSHSSVLKAR